MKNKIIAIFLLAIVSILITVIYRYLMEPINYVYVYEDIKNYDLGEGIVFVELNYQGSASVDIDEHWNMEKFDNGLPITAWEYYRLTDGFIENAKRIYANFPNIETDDEVIIMSLGRKLENLYYYKQSGYIDLYSEIAYIGEPVFSKEYYEDTMFVYTSPTYIKFPYYEDTDDNIRFNKDGDIPYEIRPYTERSNNNKSKLIREETRLDVILKKLRN